MISRRGACAAAAAVLAVAGGSAQGQAAVAERRAIVLSVPGLRAEDLARPELPMLRAIVSRAAVGWMNARPARFPGRERIRSDAAGYATLGAGSRATAGEYARRADPESWRLLREENSRLDHPVQPGLLGNLVARAGLRAGVAGHANTDTPDRSALLLAADARGRVDRVEDGPAVVARREPEPYGLATEPRGFARLRGVEFQVWVFGDLARAEHYEPLCLPEAARRHRSAALGRLNRTLMLADALVRRGATLILLSPAPAPSADPVDRLVPLLLASPEGIAGLIESPSTRTLGLAASTDFLPTVAALLRLEPPRGLVGRPVRLIADRQPSPEAWAGLHAGWVADSRRKAFFGGLPGLQALLVLLGTGGLAVRGAVAWGVRAAAASALAVLALPGALLLLPLLPLESDLLAGAALSASLAGAMAAAWALGPIRGRSLAGVLAAGTVVLLAGDLLMGAPLQRRAWMGYSVMEGARYYGIGNELGAVLTALGLLTAGWVLARRRLRSGCAVGLLGAAAVAGLPVLGANAGVALSLAVGAAVLVAAERGAGTGWRILIAAAVAGAAVVALALAADLLAPGEGRTHIGRAMAESGGIAGIAWRKLALNLHLVLHSAWTLPLLAAGAALWVLSRLTDSSARTTERGTLAGLLGAGACLLVFNDSGVVAAAECVLLAWAGAVVHPALSLCDSRRAPEGPSTASRGRNRA